MGCMLLFMHCGQRYCCGQHCSALCSWPSLEVQLARHGCRHACRLHGKLSATARIPEGAATRVLPAPPYDRQAHGPLVFLVLLHGLHECGVLELVSVVVQGAPGDGPLTGVPEHVEGGQHHERRLGSNREMCAEELHSAGTTHNKSHQHSTTQHITRRRQMIQAATQV